MSVEDKINLLGDAFRGLWKSYELQSEIEWDCFEGNRRHPIRELWCLTFIYDGMMVETPLFPTINEPLDFAIGKLEPIE